MSAVEVYDAPARGKDYIVQIRVKNGPLLRAMRAAGLNGQKLAALAGVSPMMISRFLNLRDPPLNKNGEWRRSLLAIATALRVPPDTLFPAAHLEKCLRQNSGEFEVGAAELAVMLAPPQAATPEELLLRGDVIRRLGDALSDLPAREKDVLVRLYGLDGAEIATQEELSRELGISRGRVWQIEKSAIRKLRHPRRDLRRDDLEVIAMDETA